MNLDLQIREAGGGCGYVIYINKHDHPASLICMSRSTTEIRVEDGLKKKIFSPLGLNLV